MKRIFILILTIIMVSVSAISQRTFTKESVLAMTPDELSELSLEELMYAVDVLNVSSVDELFAVIMNKTTTSASKSEESSFTTPFASTMITKAEFVQWGCNSIEEALKLIPGVTVSMKSNGNYDIHLRGLSNIVEGQRMFYTENHNTKLLLDGRDITDYIAGGMFMDFLPIGIEDIKCVEVVRGPVSALYGQNAVTGVINIITEKPSDNPDYLTSGSIQTSLDGNTTIASAATRFVFNDNFSAGVSIAIDKRQRSTEKLYIPLDKHDYVTSAYFEAWNKYGKGHTIDDYKPLTDGWVSKDDICNIGIATITEDGKYATDASGNLIWTPAIMKYTDIDDMIPDPKLAKRLQALNGYLNFRFNKTSTMDVTFGYNKTFVNTSTLEEQLISIAGRSNQGGYINVNGNINGLSWVLNYDRHSNNYCYGIPGYQVDVDRYGANLDYTFSLINDHMHIRPTIDFNGYVTKDKTAFRNETIGNITYKIGGFFNGSVVETYTFAPAVMADYKTDNGWKFIGACRLDVTTNPKRNNMNYSLAVNKNIGNNHFIRASYGRATRAAVLLNTNADFIQDHRDLGLPSYIYMKGSSHDLMYLDGYEFGYRTRPNNHVLIDLECYYSISKDYGSLKPSNSYLTTTGDEFMAWMYGALNSVSSALLTSNDVTVPLTNYISDTWQGTYTTNSVFTYTNLPYKVKQAGASVNIDWIVNPKLIFKTNLNVQKTIIDNWYKFDQSKCIRDQITNCINSPSDENGVSTSVAGFTSDIMSGAKEYASNSGYDISDPRFINRIIEYGSACANAPTDLVARYGYLMDYSNYTEHLTGIRQAYIENATEKELPNGVVIQREAMLGAYYSLMYGIRGNGQEGFILSDSKQPAFKTQNGHKSKATPSFYGSFGFIYKPANIINFSTLMTFMSKREFDTLYGVEKLPSMFNVNVKMGWCPNDNVEFFIQGHNLINRNKNEFIFSDPVKPMVTTGITCKF